MEIKFNPSKPSLPFGFFALNALLKNKPVTASVIDDTDKPALDEPFITGPEILSGEINMMRYLVRSSACNDTTSLSTSNLYPEFQSPLMTSKIDGWLDEIRDTLSATSKKTPDALMMKISKKIGDGKFVVDDKLSIADLALWSIVKSYEKAGKPLKSIKAPIVANWIKGMDEIPECQEAMKMIESLVPKTEVTESSELPKLEEPKFDPREPFSVYRKVIANEIEKATGLDFKVIYPCIEIPKGVMAEHADMCIPIPRLKIKGKPQDIAADIASKVNPNKYLTEITNMNIFVNFRINQTLLSQQLVEAVHSLKSAFGENDSMKGQNIVVEFSSPNIAKPFHAGHLRSTIIGNFIRNVCKANGAKTFAINYLGDWGKQYGLLAVGFEKYGSEELLQKDPIRHLFDVYVKINEAAKNDESIHDQARLYFKGMEEKEPEALGLWKRFRELSIEKYREIYARLGVQFDIYSGESQFQEGMIKALEHLKAKNLLTDSEGAVIVDLKKYKLTPAVVQKADGATLYITRDIAAAWERHELYKFDKMMYVVASQQDLHFQQLFKILELAGFDWHDKCQHMNFGLVKGMSTRKGTVVFLEDILNEAQSVMHSVMKKNEEKYARITDPEHTSNIIGLSAVMIQDMSSKRVKDYEFDWDRMTSFEGDTGPYLQYSHTRLCSIERMFLESLNLPSGKASYAPPLPMDAKQLNEEYLKHPKLQSVVFMLSQYPEIIKMLTERQYEPCNLVTYLMKVCHRVSSCLDEVYVMGRPKDEAIARFWVYWSARVILGNGMRILGLTPLEAM